MNSGEFRDRLETVDKSGKRLWVYADIVKGPWRLKRKLVAYLLVVVYLFIPWIEINSKPFLKFDFLNNTFWIFGNNIGFHQTPIILSVVMGTIFLILAITAIAGRAWCGWACPQSVFLEFIYRPIEALIEGYPGKRKKLDLQKCDENKILKKFIKYSAFIFFSFIIANTFVAYFVGGKNILNLMSTTPSENPMFFILMLIIFSGFMFNFSWFREQMCTIACPYGRFQSVLLDKNSKIIGYDSSRGEPRGKKSNGDCVDCHRCVQVCPTGIDIRNGLQLECISCAACIDACNIVMQKLNRKKNLIKYTTENELANIATNKTHVIRPLIYFLFSFSLYAFANYKIFIHPQVEITVLRKTTDPQIRNNQIVVNQLSFRLENESNDVSTVYIKSVESDTQIITGENPVALAPKEKRIIQVFAETSQSTFNHSSIKRNLSFEYNKTQNFVEVLLFPKEAP
ncbi:MAG: cytochrome c oxidase accessory protein CcoG [Oligoflexia bacterium]|nr:cytochrome c oxidase accessory protein CcoG [Oligoflexia bacterium]